MDDSTLSLDTQADDVEKAIVDDQKDVKDAESTVEEKIEEDIEDAHEEEDTAGEDEEDAEDLENEADSLDTAEEAVESYCEGKGSKASLYLAKRILHARLEKQGTAFLLASQEDDEADMDQLRAVLKTEREKVLDAKANAEVKPTDKRKSAWEKLGKVALNVKARLDKGNAISKERKVDSVHLTWKPLDETTRQYFEYLTEGSTSTVADLVKTTQSLRDCLTQVETVAKAELAWLTENATNADAAAAYALFLSTQVAQGDRSTVFEKDLIGGFNILLSDSFDQLNGGKMVTGFRTNPGVVNVLNEVSSVNSDVEGDAREDVAIKSFAVNAVQLVAYLAEAAVAYYSAMPTASFQTLSWMIANRLLRLVVAVSAVICDVSNPKTVSNESDYIVVTDDGEGSVVPKPMTVNGISLKVPEHNGEPATAPENEEPTALPEDNLNVPDHF